MDKGCDKYETIYRGYSSPDSTHYKSLLAWTGASYFNLKFNTNIHELA